MAESFSNITMVILAAGASKRMGIPKQTLPLKGNTLLGHVIQTALKVQVDEVIVVLGAHYEIAKSEITEYPITILNNINWKNGIGGSIALGVKNVRPTTDGVLIILADQPFVTSKYLETMIQNFIPSMAQIVATSYGKVTFGVPVIFDKLYFDELIQLDNEHGAKYLLKKYDSHVIALIPPVENVDLDTMSDYEEYKHLL